MTSYPRSGVVPTMNRTGAKQPTITASVVNMQLSEHVFYYLAALISYLVDNCLVIFVGRWTTTCSYHLVPRLRQTALFRRLVRVGSLGLAVLRETSFHLLGYYHTYPRIGC